MFTHRKHTRATASQTPGPASDGPPPPTAPALTTDILIVGSGLAGTCAALAAAEAGAAAPLVLERHHGGGATALSGGVVYSGGATAQQRAAGVPDSPAAMFRYLQTEVRGAVDDATLRRFCEGSARRLAWLEGHGARFGRGLCPYKTSYPTDGYCLYYSGNEKARAGREVAEPAPRGHRHEGRWMTGGDLWGALWASAVEKGVQFAPATKVEEVLLGEDGGVVGVKCRMLRRTSAGFAKHRKLVLRARGLQMAAPKVAAWYSKRADAIWQKEGVVLEVRCKVVVLAAGGYSLNAEMTQKYIPSFKMFAPIGTAGDDGSGISLGLVAGGTVSHMDRFSAWRFLSPPAAFLEGIVVSKTGLRIAGEDLYGATFTEVMVLQHGGTGFLILDSVQWAKAKAQLDEQTQMPWKGMTQYLMHWARKKSSTLEGLASSIGVPHGQLNQTIEAYNSAIENKTEDPVHKADEYRSPITKSPFYAIDVSMKTGGPQIVSALALGGLRVDGESGLLLKENGETIPRLYAAGRTAVGICANSYVSGLSLADCVFSGQRAGEHAAATVVGLREVPA